MALVDGEAEVVTVFDQYDHSSNIFQLFNSVDFRSQVTVKGSFILERFLSESESDNIFASVLYIYIRAISERKRFPIWFVYMS